ncbi:unnamed protein product [Notodromas monacha]|uniref:Transmembrane protein 188 n=1 Tax=Notodromas monacha TaxID=399045 RepID=A0A7R9BID1_9CRUS|nr:unnamed protein product [Notodromas monacha]CAG0916056.1 unnamed protein product [Notodromas monacha]
MGSPGRVSRVKRISAVPAEANLESGMESDPDLKAFERRLTEVISCAKPTAIRWRIVLAVVTACTAIGAWQWINDPAISRVTFWDSLVSHPFFLVSFLILVLLFLFGVHSRIQAHIIIAERTKTVLEDFNMSCDNNGKLILRPTTAAT